MDIPLKVVLFLQRSSSMARVKFTAEQQEILRNNQYTVRVTEYFLSLSKEFKEIFMKEFLAGGATPRDILSKYGYSVDILGKKRMWGIAHSIKKEYYQNESFRDIRSRAYGPAAALQHEEDKVRKLQVQVDYLTQEVEFLKKISSIRNTMK